MNKYFIFVSDRPLDVLSIERLQHSYEGIYEYTSYDDYSGALYSPMEDLEKIQRYLSSPNHPRMMVLCSPYGDEAMVELAKSLLGFFPNQLVHPSDLYFNRLRFRDHTFYTSLSGYFSNVSPELMETAGAYLRQGCDGLKAAKALHIHRNTFNYRLNAFIMHSGLDIRDYHNALLLEIYFQLRIKYS